MIVQLYQMQQQSDIETVFKDISNNKQILISSTFNKTTLAFLKKWFQFGQNQKLKEEQGYIWELFHGWSLKKYLNDETIQQEQIKVTPQTISKVNSFQNFKETPLQEAVLTYLSKNEAILEQGKNVFWINPTISQDELTKIANKQFSFVIVLTTSSFQQMFSVLKIIATRPDIKIITLQIIYQKLTFLLDYLKTHQQQKYKPISLGKIYLLKVNEFFEYGGFLWLAKHCCWYEPTYDLSIVPNKGKDKIFEIESLKLTQIKYIYYGWKKGFISEQNYQKYTKHEEQNMSISKGSSHHITEIQVPDPKNNKFLDFIQKEFIRQLENEERQELWSCCQALTLTPGQLVVKSSTLFDFVYILFEGKFQHSQKGKQTKIIETPTEKCQLYGLQQLRKGDKYNQYTLKALTDCFVMRVERQNFKFLLYDYF